MSMLIIIAVLLVFTSLFVALSLFPYAGSIETRGVGAEIEARSRRR